MRLRHGLHLAYCTNIHRSETWDETLLALKTHTLAVRDRVSDGKPFAIGLRLSNRASLELYQPIMMEKFRRWLDENNCYVFTINGFPFGTFHGTHIKEQVYVPDWQNEARLDYTVRLFRILAELVPSGVEGSVSTLPGSYKSFVQDLSQLVSIRENLWRCLDAIETLCLQTGTKLHLGIEPEPFGLWENTGETIACFESMETHRPGDPKLYTLLGVNYDACHFAMQFEKGFEALNALSANRIRISKLHLSSALRVRPSAAIRAKLKGYSDDVYLHQVIGRKLGVFVRYEDLSLALAASDDCDEWRVHFHIPLYSSLDGDFGDTSGDLLETLDWLGANPLLCSHLEIETYTWEVLPAELRAASVVEQLVREYEWLLPQMKRRELA